MVEEEAAHLKQESVAEAVENYQQGEAFDMAAAVAWRCTLLNAFNEMSKDIKSPNITE